MLNLSEVHPYLWISSTIFVSLLSPTVGNFDASNFDSWNPNSSTRADPDWPITSPVIASGGSSLGASPIPRGVDWLMGVNLVLHQSSDSLL